MGCLSTSGQLLPCPDSSVGTRTELPETEMRAVSDIYVGGKVPTVTVSAHSLFEQPLDQVIKERKK